LHTGSETHATDPKYRFSSQILLLLLAFALRWFLVLYCDCEVEISEVLRDMVVPDFKFMWLCCLFILNAEFKSIVS